MPTLEEIVFQAGRDALADQDGVVIGIRQRTGTLLAAHALVASFLGATTVKAKGLHAELYDEAASEAETDTLGWLVSAAYGYHNLRRANAKRVRIMGGLLTVLGVLMVLQTLFWLIALR